MENTTTTLETLISFDGDGEMKFRSNSPLDDSGVMLLVSIIKPFCSNPEAKNRLLNEAAILRVKAKLIDGVLEWYGVGFTNSDNLTITTTTTTTTGEKVNG